jgi:hypothetical protein
MSTVTHTTLLRDTHRWETVLAESGLIGMHGRRDALDADRMRGSVKTVVAV